MSSQKYSDDKSSPDEELILKSSYFSNGELQLNSDSVCVYLLERAKENAAAGKTKWLTNSITGETIFYSELDSMTKSVASFMYRRGMRKSDVAIYLTTDVTRIFVIIAGVWRAGGAMYSSYVEDTADTLLSRIKDSKAKWIFCDPVAIIQCRAAVEQVEWPVEIIVFGEVEGCISVDSVFKDDGSECPEQIPSTLDDPLLILVTSGTTGKSKGAIYTNRSVLAFCIGTDGTPRNNPKPALWLIKCTHVLGVLYPMRNIFVGDWSIMMHQITKENIFKAVDKYHPFLVFGFPTFLQFLAVDPEAEKYDRSSVEVVCTGGIVITDTFHKTMKTLPNLKYVINGYGMTECGGVTTTVDISGNAKEFCPIPNIPHLSVGKLYPNTKLKVLDLNTGELLGPGQKGELCVTSSILCSGYCNLPEENANTFNDGWWRTGDIGYYDKDGFLFICDRLKDTFKYFNNHISPVEIEEILLQHPAVAEACVFGVEDPDGGGDFPRAVVVLKPKNATTAQEIQSFADGKIASYKRLRGGVFIVPSLQRGKTGKVVRNMIANMSFTS